MSDIWANSYQNRYLISQPSLVHSLENEIRRVQSWIHHCEDPVSRTIWDPDGNAIDMWRTTLFTRQNDLNDVKNFQSSGVYLNPSFPYQPIYITEYGKDDKLLREFDASKLRQYMPRLISVEDV